MKTDFQAVVFDMDGVIFDSERAMRDIWVELALSKGLADMDQVYPRIIGTNRSVNRRIVEEAYGSAVVFDDFFAEARALFDSRYGGGRIPLKAGVLLLLSALKDNGIRTALASSTGSEIVRREVTENGLAPYFDAVIGGDAVTRSKPFPDIFLAACASIGAAPEKCICIEDSYNGIRAASAAGMRPIMVPDLLPATKEMEELAEAILPDPEAVWEYLGD